jgi:predicted AAA+ superfamily ATPase
MIQRLCRLPSSRSCLLLGPRQTGKSTLVRSLLPTRSWSVDLLQQDVFLRYSKEPERFRREVEAKA